MDLLNYIVANNPRKFYDTTGQAIGYIVNYNLENKPYGYVVFDTTYNRSILRCMDRNY